MVLFISDALIADFLAHLLYFLISVDTLNWSRVRMDNFKHFVRGHSRFISNRTLNYKMQSYLTDTATYMRFISYRKLKIHIHYTVSLYIYTVYTNVYSMSIYSYVSWIEIRHFSCSAYFTCVYIFFVTLIGNEIRTYTGFPVTYSYSMSSVLVSINITQTLAL